MKLIIKAFTFTIMFLVFTSCGVASDSPAAAVIQNQKAMVSDGNKYVDSFYGSENFSEMDKIELYGMTEICTSYSDASDFSFNVKDTEISEDGQNAVVKLQIKNSKYSSKTIKEFQVKKDSEGIWKVLK